jgi:glycerol-3-phosphate dehydrogenase (NAD(P)+)
LFSARKKEKKKKKVFSKISIIGGGELGKAIAYIAERSDINFSIWDKDLEKSSVSSIEECLKGAEAVFFCVPSWGLRSALSSVIELKPEGAPIILFSKGLEADTFLSAPEIAASVFSKEEVIFIGGPMIAEEIILGKGCRAVVSGKGSSVENVAEIFQGDNISFELAEDAFSVALLGVMKNIYAMVIGAAEGAEKGRNIRSYIFSKAILEMAGVVDLLGGDGSLAFSSAGTGDLIATGTSRESSNWSVGFALSSGTASEKTSEGAASIEGVCARLGEVVNEMALLSFARNMLSKGSVSPEDWEIIL